MGSLLRNLGIATKLDGSIDLLDVRPVSLNALVGRVVDRHRPIARMLGVDLNDAVPEEALSALGDVTLIDAPMSGAPHSARLRQLSFMLGGPDEALDRLMPLFQAMGKHAFRLGPLGAGMTAKVLNNYVASASVVAVRRAYARARELGVDLDKLRAVMSASSGATWFGDHFHDIDWAREGFDAGNTIGILEKDVRSGLDAMEGAARAAPDAYDEALIAALRVMEPFAE